MTINEQDLFYQVQLYTGKRNISPIVFADEHFEPHPKYPRYLVSTYGRVYDTKNKCMKIPAKRQYLTYDISIAPRRLTSIGAHRMVLETFNPNPNSDNLVPNHKDLNKWNNRLENLEWTTQKENVNHAIKTGVFNPQGEDNPTSKHSNNEVKMICYLLEQNVSYKEICKQMKYPYNMANISFISGIKNKNTWNHISDNYNF